MFFVVGLELAVLLVVFLGCVLHFCVWLLIKFLFITKKKKKTTYCDV